MSSGRMKDLEPELAALVREWLETARETDAREDEEYGPDRRGDELPEHVREKVKKLLQVREAKARLEHEAREKAERLAKERAELAGARAGS